MIVNLNFQLTGKSTFEIRDCSCLKTGIFCSIRANDASKTLKGDCKAKNTDEDCKGFEKKESVLLKRNCESDALLNCSKVGDKPSLTRICRHECKKDDKLRKDDCRGPGLNERLHSK